MSFDCTIFVKWHEARSKVQNPDHDPPSDFRESTSAELIFRISPKPSFPGPALEVKRPALTDMKMLLLSAIAKSLWLYNGVWDELNRPEATDRHCEKQSDEAIQPDSPGTLVMCASAPALDRFASLAMTVSSFFGRSRQ